MAENSAIEWTDSTFNPWIGCTKVSPACDHCYAEVSTPSRTRSIKWGAGKARQRTSAENWKLPLRWNARPFVQCPACGWRGEWDQADRRHGRCPICGHLPERFLQARRRVFCASLSDVFDNEVPPEWLADLLNLIRLTPNLDWLLLTKRIGNWRERLKAALATIGSSGESVTLRDFIGNWLNEIPPTNVWIGATICNQEEADRDVPKLLRVPAAVRFVSIEPMLGPVDLKMLDLGELYWLNAFEGKETIYHDGGMPTKGPFGQLHWIIAGGESGANARPSHSEWFRSLRDQCAAAGVPFLFKQWGEYLPADADECDAGISEKQLVWSDGQLWRRDDGQLGGLALLARVGKKAAGRTLDGKIHHDFPEVRHD